MKLEAEHSESERLIQSLVDALPFAVSIFDLKTGDILYLNKLCREMLAQIGKKEADYNKAAELFREDIFTTWREGLYDSTGKRVLFESFSGERVFRGEKFKDIEVSWRSPTGALRYFLASGSALPAFEDQPRRGIVVFVEITNSVIQSEQLRQSITAREEFLSVASHELKTPITSVLLQAQSLRNRAVNTDILNEDLVKRLTLMEHSAKKLSNLVQELLDISRLASPQSLKIHEADLREVMENVCLRFDIIASAQGIEIRRNLPKERFRGFWDTDRIERISSNLISNAIKYGNRQPIDVNMSNLNGFVVVDVRDRGIGVRPEDRTRIFERFERAVSGEEYPGIGLGLWLASETARSMNGTIDVILPPDGLGTIFRLTLPFIKRGEQ